MKVFNPGHSYKLDVYDNKNAEAPASQVIHFMKRVGAGYPGNTGERFPGTNCQEVIRVLIDRVKYLDGQYAHQNNKAIIAKLQDALWLFEDRAAERHGFAPHDIDFRPEDIELEPTCEVCGHIICKGH